MNRKARIVLSAAAASAMFNVGVQAATQNFNWQHTNTIDINSEFGGNIGYGTNALSVAFDGTNAYVGGYIGFGTNYSVGIVQIQNVLTATPTLNGLAATQFISNTTGSRGINDMGYDPVSGKLYYAYDNGGSDINNPGFLGKIVQVGTDGTVGWTVNNPGGQRPQMLAIDPMVGGANGPEVAFGSQSNGRRASLKTSDGSLDYTFSGGTNPGGIITGSPNNYGFSWRGMAFDSAGDIALSSDKGYQFGVRNTINQWKTTPALGGATNVTGDVIAKTVTNNNVGQGVAIVEGIGDANLYAFAATASGATTTSDFTDSTGGLQPAQDLHAVHIRNLDGTTTGVTQTELNGNEDGIGLGAAAAGFTGELKNIAMGKDANGLPVMVVVSYDNNRLDVYQTEPTYTADANGNWGDTSKWLANVSPNAATLNAHMAATTAPRTVTLEGPKTVKDLKLDSPNSYTIAGTSTNNLTIDAPTGQSGQVTVLQGSHTISAPVTLNKNTVFTVPTGSLLTVSNNVSSATVNLTKNGAGELKMKNVRAAGLTINGGSFHIAASGDAVGSTSALTAVPVIDPSAKLDIDDNSMVINYTGSTPLQQVHDLIALGRGPAGFGNATWNGLGGITSSKASPASQGLGGIGSGVDPAIGYGENSAMPIASFSAFNGQTVNSSSILIKYTRGADATLDGVVDNSDVTVVGTEFNNPNSGQWYLGDFDYSGTCDNSDVTALGTLFNPTAPPLSPAQLNAEFGSAFAQAFAAGQASAAVPEPTSVFVLAAAGVGMLAQRRKRR